MNATWEVDWGKRYYPVLRSDGIEGHVENGVVTIVGLFSFARRISGVACSPCSLHVVWASMSLR